MKQKITLSTIHFFAALIISAISGGFIVTAWYDQFDFRLTSSSETYYNPRYSFAIDVPINWTIEEKAIGLGLGDITEGSIEAVREYHGGRPLTFVRFSSPATRVALHNSGCSADYNSEYPPKECWQYYPYNDFSFDWSPADAINPRDFDNWKTKKVGPYTWYVVEEEMLGHAMIHYYFQDKSGASYIFRVPADKEEAFLSMLKTFRQR